MKNGIEKSPDSHPNLLHLRQTKHDRVSSLKAAAVNAPTYHLRNVLHGAGLKTTFQIANYKCADQCTHGQAGLRFVVRKQQSQIFLRQGPQSPNILKQ